MAGAPAVSEIEELRAALAAEKAAHAETLTAKAWLREIIAAKAEELRQTKEELAYQLSGIYQHVDAVRNAEEVRVYMARTSWPPKPRNWTRLPGCR